jgi:hypothetical protein
MGEAMATWRERFRPLIASVIAAHTGEPMTRIRAALREAFPAGPREYHPYKIWLSECRKQLGIKKQCECHGSIIPLFETDG